MVFKPKKAAGKNIPSRFIKLVSIDCTLSTVFFKKIISFTFLSKVEVATVVLKKRGNNKHVTSNFTPVSLLHCFTKR